MMKQLLVKQIGRLIDIENIGIHVFCEPDF